MDERSEQYKRIKATIGNWPEWKREAAYQLMYPQKDEEPTYPDAVDGDIYFNPFFLDLWIVHNGQFIKINDGYTIDLDEPEGFVKVGHVDGILNKNGDGKYV